MIHVTLLGKGSDKACSGDEFVIFGFVKRVCITLCALFKHKHTHTLLNKVDV
jgi:hypothetical protein